MMKFNINFIKKYVSLFLILSLTVLAGCGAPFRQEPVSQTGFYFDTVITVTVYDHGSEELLAQCMDLAAHYENLLKSLYRRQRYMECQSQYRRFRNGGGRYPKPS